MFCDLHVSLKQPFVGGYKFVEFVLLFFSVHLQTFDAFYLSCSLSQKPRTNQIMISLLCSYKPNIPTL